MAHPDRSTSITVFGVLSIVLGALSLLALLGALLLAVVFGGGLGGRSLFDLSGFGAAIATVAFVVVGPMAVLGIATGIGVLRLRPWSRGLGVVVSLLALPQLPLGTAYGVFGLWLLTREETKRALSG